MDVERDLLRVGGPALIAEAVGVSAVAARGERVVFRRDGLLVVLAVSVGVLDLELERGQQSVSLGRPHQHRDNFTTYPEINVQIPTASKLSVAHLEGDGHQVVLVQVLVEAFSRVRLELDGVCGRGGDPPQCGDQEGGRRESHSEVWRIPGSVVSGVGVLNGGREEVEVDG